MPLLEVGSVRGTAAVAVAALCSLFIIFVILLFAAAASAGARLHSPHLVYCRDAELGREL